MAWIFVFSVAFSGNSVQNLFLLEVHGHHAVDEPDEPGVVEES